MKNRSCKLLPLVLLMSFNVFASKVDSLKSILDTVEKPLKKALIIEDIAEYFRYQGNFDSSYYYLDKMKEICDEHELKDQTGEYYNYYGMNKNIEGKLDESMAYFNKAMEIYTELYDSAGLANIYENIGISYKDNAQYKKAIECQLKSLEIREKIGLVDRIPSVYCNIAVIYERMEDGEKMKEYMYKAKAYAENMEEINEVQLISIYNELGNVCDNDTDLDSSLYYYNKGLDLAKEIDWKRGVSTILGNIADIYYDLKQFDKALEMHYESLELEIKANNVYGIIKEHQFLSRIHRDLGNYKEANKHGLKAYELAVETDMLNEIANACEILSDLYARQGNYKHAFNYQSLFKEYSDSIAGTDHKNYVANLEEKYESTVKEQKIDLLTKENEIHQKKVRINRVIIIAVSLIAVVIVLFFVFLLRLRRKQNSLQKADMEQKLLRNQMNPHFIFNALGTIQNFMYKNQSKEAGRYLGEFSTLTRAILKHTREDSITLEEEITSLKSYIELEQLRLKGQFDYKIHYNEDLELDFIQIPPMLIQPFVENAIKHGIENTDKKGLIDLDIEDLGKFIRFTIQDNGKGIKHIISNKIKKHKSYAMQIFDERRKILKRQFNKSINFAISDLSDEGSCGTKVIMEIPIIEE